LAVLGVLFFDISARGEFAREWFRIPNKVEDSLFDEVTLKKLYATQVRINWNNIDIQSAIADLAAQCKASDPDHLGVKFSLTKLPVKRLVYNRTGNTSAMNAILTFLLQHDLTDLEIHKGEVVLTPSPPVPPL
jgi:hypothetical protein